MIQRNKHQNIFENYPFSAEQLSAEEISQFAELEEWRLVLKENKYLTFRELIQKVVLSFLEDFKVYLVYVESFPQPKSKLRTFKKLFYNPKKQIGEQNLYETEIDFTAHKSILTALIQLDETNFEYSINQMNSNLAFGFIVRKNTQSFPTNPEIFLTKLVNQRLPEAQPLKVNILKVVAENYTDNNLIFTLQSTGKDEEIISFFTKNNTGLGEKINQISSLDKEESSIKN